MPDGLRTPSERPEKITCLVTGWMVMKSPCVHTSVSYKIYIRCWKQIHVQTKGGRSYC